HFVNFFFWRGGARRASTNKEKGRRGEKAGKRIRKRIARMNIMQPAGGWNEHCGISRAASESVKPVGVRPKNRGITIVTQLRAPFERMRPARESHVFLELIDVSIRTENRSVGGIESLKEPVAKGNPWLRFVAGDKNRRAANVPERRLRTKVRRNCARISHRRTALMVEELHAEIRINRRLIGIRGWPSNLVAAEAKKQIGLLGNLMIK